MGNELETGRSKEQQEREKESKVILYLFRHAEADRESSPDNINFALTKRGRDQGLEKAKSIPGERNPNQSAAVGAPRKRAWMTATLAMTGDDTINGAESLEELRKKLDGQGKKDCSRIKINPRLDFYMDKKSPFGKKALEARNIHHNYLKFIVEKSDDLAIDLKDPNASTYSRQAAGVAKVVRNYAAIAHQWNKLANSGEKKYSDPNLERFLGSHGGVIESFLLKVIEKTYEGVAERDKLIGLIGNQFANTEGIEISINGQGKDQKIHISYKREKKSNPDQSFVFKQDVPMEIINEIIDEGDRKI